MAGDAPRHKAWVFAGWGTLVALSFAYIYALAPRLRDATPTCPADEPTACRTADRVSRAVLWISAAIYLVGFFTAYLPGPILAWAG